MGQKKVAIFDVDGVLFRSHLLIALMEQLIAQGAISPSVHSAYSRQRRKWLNREGSYEEYFEAFWKAFHVHLKGVFYGDFADASKAVVADESKHVYRYTRDLIRKLKERDYFLLAISHSPKAVVDPFCKRLGFDKTYGVVYEMGPQDKLTGAIIDEHLIWNKGNIVKRALEKESLSLRWSIGVGDTEADIPFLDMVDTPIAFNPNKKLYAYAKRMEWKIVVERKDVVYEL